MYNSRPSGGRSGHRGFNRRPFRGGSFGGKKSRFAPKALDPRLFVKPASPEIAAEIVIEHAFSDFNLHPQIHENLQIKGITTPTPIQDRTLEPALANQDILGLADTGTGKTASFLLPTINKLIANRDQTVIIVAPTRELAVQIREEFRQLADKLSLYACLLIGGSDIHRQINEIKRRPHVYIGTPGRIRDLYNRRALRLDNTHTVVLDEVDRMLDMGFVKEITELLSFLPQNRQTLLFSATIDPKIEEIALKFMNNPVKISVKSGATSQNVDQNVIKASGKANKINVLNDLLTKEGFRKVLIFGRTKYGVEELSISLRNSGFQVEAIHGDKRQSQRENALRKFRTNQINILIATDVAARGIDVKDITHVINFDQPDTYENYVHRIGRTGRAGQTGYALTFVD